MRALLTCALCSICILIGSSLLVAHPGSLDKNGCHTNHKTGEYHCHGAPKSSPPPTNSSSASPARSTSSSSSSQPEALTSAPAQAWWTGKTLQVLDGDTIVVNHDGKPEKIRLFGIDSPEEKQAFSDEAKKFTSDLVLEKVVAVHPIEKDVYGRTVARVFQNGTKVNEEIVKAGYAWWFEKYAPGDEDFKKLQAEARASKKGLWADPDAMAPWEFRHPSATDPDKVPEKAGVQPFAATSSPARPAAQTEQVVYVTKTGTKYHRAGCSFLKSAIPMALSEAKARYSPCSVCKPPK